MIYLGVGLIGTLILLSFFLEGIVWAICTICLIIYYFLRFIACSYHPTFQEAAIFAMALTRSLLAISLVPDMMTALYEGFCPDCRTPLQPKYLERPGGYCIACCSTWQIGETYLEQTTDDARHRAEKP